MSKIKQIEVFIKNGDEKRIAELCQLGWELTCFQMDNEGEEVRNSDGERVYIIYTFNLEDGHKVLEKIKELDEVTSSGYYLYEIARTPIF